jgi:hypothetical protein
MQASPSQAVIPANVLSGPSLRWEVGAASAFDLEKSVLSLKQTLLSQEFDDAQLAEILSRLDGEVEHEVDKVSSSSPRLSSRENSLCSNRCAHSTNQLESCC